MKWDSKLEDVVAELEKRQGQAVEAVGHFAVGRVKLLTPVDTGNLRTSNDFQTQGSMVAIGNYAEYAEFLELGTRYMKAQPFLVPGIMNNRKEIDAIIKKYMKGW